MDKGFETRCLDCGSTNCEIEYDYWDNYDHDGDRSSELMGFSTYCKDCGQSE